MKLLVVYIILLIHMLDTAIANVAMVAIMTSLGRDPQDAHWTITAFFVGLATAIPFVALLVKRLGEGSALTAALSLSIVSIGFCGLSTSFAGFVFWRFAQGLTSGLVALLLQKLMMKYAGPEHRAYALSLWASAISLAPVAGPVLGAVVISLFDWRVLFLAQVPILLGACFLIRDEFSLRPVSGVRWQDGALLALLAGASMGIEVGLDTAVKSVRDESALAAGCFGMAAILLALLYRELKRQGVSLFDWSLAKDADYLRYAGSAALMGAVTVAGSIVYTVWLVVQLDIALLELAKILAAGGIIAAGLTPLIGRYKNLAGLRFCVVCGCGFLFASFALTARLTENAGFDSLVLPRVLAGMGTALCSPLGFLSVSRLDATRVLAASSLSMYVRTILGSFLIVLTAGISEHLKRYFSERAIADGVGTAGADPAAAPPLGHTYRLLDSAAANQSLHVVFMAAAAIALLIGLTLMFRRPALPQLAAASN